MKSLLYVLVLLSFSGFSQDFITTWQTDIAIEGETTISVPIPGTGTYDIDWGDGTESIAVTANRPLIAHIYENPGTYTVSIDFTNSTGISIDFGSLSENASAQIVSVEQWGNMAWASMEESFAGCVNLVINATDAPDLSQVESMGSMFKDASSVNADLSSWDVSNVTSMQGLFLGASAFNGNISSWNVSNVEIMSNMFGGASSFNQDISTWDVSNVTNMFSMFGNATSFNQNIGNWNVNNVQNMSSMFVGATSFNQDIGNWNVSNVQSMNTMFGTATSFNQDLNNWDVSNVTSMIFMFAEAESFNGDITSWDVSNVTNMSGMFGETAAFNQDIGNWNVSSVQNMRSMFLLAESFNQDLSSWNVSGVTNMTSMFAAATSFNQDLSSWDVSNVTNMTSMFGSATSFNQDLSSWDFSSVSSMFAMFESAPAFNQDLGAWDITAVSNMEFMLDGSGLSRINYENTLIGWAQQDVQPNVILGAGGLTYCAASEARGQLIIDDGWDIRNDSQGITEEIFDLGEDINACAGDELTFSIDESGLSFETYTISTLFGNTATDGPLTFTFDETFAATASTQDVFVTVELTDQGGCIGTDQVQLFDNTMKNWGIGSIITNDPGIVVSNTILPETHDTFEWDFGDGTTNTTDINPSYTYLANGDYTVTLTVSNECGDESLSTSVTIAGIVTLAFEEESDLLVYPNPTSDILYFDDSRELEVKLFSLEGRQVLRGNTSEGAIEISRLHEGQYIIHLLEGDRLVGTQKIVKKN